MADHANRINFASIVHRTVKLLIAGEPSKEGERCERKRREYTTVGLCRFAAWLLKLPNGRIEDSDLLLVVVLQRRYF